jgi:hypothetical protein
MIALNLAIGFASATTTVLTISIAIYQNHPNTFNRDINKTKGLNGEELSKNKQGQIQN